METVRLGSVAKVVTGTTPKLHAFDKTKNGIPFLTPSDFDHASEAWNVKRFIDPSASDQLSSRIIPRGATAVTCIASIGKTTYVHTPVLTNQQINSAIPILGRVHSRFLYYALLWARPQIEQYAGGSVSPILNKSAFEQIEIPIFKQRTQGAIGAFFGALDDKIAANSTVIRIAHALTIGLVDLNSEDSSQAPLNCVTSLISRGVTPRYDRAGEYVVLNQKCIRDSQVDLEHARLMKALPKSPDKVLRQNDVLVNSTGKGTLGRIARWTSSEPNTSVDTHVSIVRFDPEVADPAFAGTALSTMERLVEDLAEGSTGQTELKRELLGSLELSLPPLDVQREVGQRIELLDELCRTRSEENLTLTKTRDELLPLLMSGKITVKEAEQEATSAGLDIAGEENKA